MAPDPAGSRWDETTTLHGHREEIEALQASVIDRLEREGWDQEARFALRLVLEESLVNAHVHGNRRDLARSITASWSLSPDRIIVEVEDEGGGFDPSCVPDPTEEHNLEIPSGRGLVLIRAYMDEVSHNDRGNRVTMVRHRHRGPAAS